MNLKYKKSSLFNIGLFGIEKQKSVLKTIYIRERPKSVAKIIITIIVVYEYYEDLEDYIDEVVEYDTNVDVVERR